VIASTLSLAFRYPALHRVQWCSREVLENLQWRRFKRLLHFANANSPYYRHHFAEAGMTPETIKDRTDLDRIPITTREDLRNPDRLICHGYRAEDLHCSFTTGSTGRRTRAYFDDRAWVLAKHLLKMRARLTTGVSPTDRIALLQESETAKNRSEWRERLFRLRSFSIDQPMATLLTALRDFAPTVLYGFPSHLGRLANAVDGEMRLSRVYTSGELLPREERRAIETAFGAPVLDVYGCTEVKEIAWQCLERDGYHINSDWLLVEVLDDKSARGREGPILVTALYNHAMPIIRYRLGDTGTLLDEPCACGRGFPLMRPTGGRTVDYFEIPDGSRVSPYAMTHAMEQVSGIRQFQIIQTSPNQVTVRTVVDGDQGSAVDHQIRSQLGSVLPNVAIEVSHVDSIDSVSSAKFHIVVSEVGRS